MIIKSMTTTTITMTIFNTTACGCHMFGRCAQDFGCNCHSASNCRQRQTDPDHPHNEVDMPRLKVQEMFQEEKTAELFQMEERIKAKRLGLSLGNLSQISESPHLPLDASDEGGSLHKAYRRTACELINHRGPLHPLLMKFVKKEENTLFRIFQFKSWLQAAASPAAHQ